MLSFPAIRATIRSTRCIRIASRETECTCTILISNGGTTVAQMLMRDRRTLRVRGGQLKAAIRVFARGGSCNSSG